MIATRLPSGQRLGSLAHSGRAGLHRLRGGDSIPDTCNSPRISGRAPFAGIRQAKGMRIVPCREAPIVSRRSKIPGALVGELEPVANLDCLGVVELRGRQERWISHDLTAMMSRPDQAPVPV